VPPRSAEPAETALPAPAPAIDADKVTPGNAEGSPLIVRLRDNSMPPPSSQLPRRSGQQIERLATFIEALDPGTLPCVRPPAALPASSLSTRSWSG
jgi:hypothetical protein